MKKPLIAIVAILAVLVASFLYVRSQMGIGDPARLLPPGTVAFSALPDLPRSIMRWPKTTLARIGAEPEMKAFMEKPLAFLQRERGGDEAIDILLGLKPARLYAAALSVEGSQPAMLVGFQFWGGRGEFDKAIARLRAQLYGAVNPEPTRESHQGAEILSTPLTGGGTLYSATQSRWGFLSNNREALLQSLDRAAGRNVEPALADDPAYTKVLARLPEGSDFLGFVRPGPVLDALLAFAATMGAKPDENQVEQVKKAEAAGFAIKIDGSDLRDAVFILRQEPPEIGKLTHQGIQFTTAGTLAYFDFLFRLDSLAEIASPWMAGLPAAPDGSSVGLESLPLAIGNEAAVIVDWPAESIRPGVALTVPIKDPVIAESLINRFSALLPETTVRDVNGLKFYGFPSLRSAFLNPTLAMGDGFLVAGLDVPDVEAALAGREKPETLEGSAAFAPALPIFRAANETFGFLDSKAVFERAFPALRQIIVFGAALMPGVDEIVDASKLPATETISKHLTPIVLSQSRFPDGYLVESAGPVTMLQVAAAAAGGGTAFFGPSILGR